MKITFIFSCSGMFRDVPACSGIFHVSSCSRFYRRPICSTFKADERHEKFSMRAKQTRTGCQVLIKAKNHWILRKLSLALISRNKTFF